MEEYFSSYPHRPLSTVAECRRVHLWLVIVTEESSCHYIYEDEYGIDRPKDRPEDPHYGIKRS